MAWLHIVGLNGANPNIYNVGSKKVVRLLAETKEANCFHDGLYGTKVIRTIEDKVFDSTNKLLGIRTINETLLDSGKDKKMILSRKVDKEVFNASNELVKSTETNFRSGGTREQKILRHGKENVCEGKVYYNNSGKFMVMC